MGIGYFTSSISQVGKFLTSLTCLILAMNGVIESRIKISRLLGRMIDHIMEMMKLKCWGFHNFLSLS